MYGYIYKTTNMVNNKIYIGKKKGEFCPTYYGSGKLIKLSIEKYGLDNFKVEIIKECYSLKEINEQEKYFIEKLFPEYNIAAGGTGGNTMLLMPENEKRILIEKRSKSLSIKHNNLSKEERLEWNKNISNSKKGKPSFRPNYHHTEEVKKRISESNKKAIKPDRWYENNKLVGLRRRGTPASNRKKVECDGIIFDSITQACKEINISKPTLYKRIKEGKYRYVE